MKLGSPAFKTLAVGVTLLNCVAASALSWYDRFDDAIRRFLVSGVDTSYVTFSANSWEMPMVLNSYGQAYRLTLDNGETVRLESGEVREAGIVAPYWGGAVELRTGMIHWLGRNFRISLASTQYGSMGWQNGELFSAHEWLTCLYLTWCFGIR